MRISSLRFIPAIAALTLTFSYMESLGSEESGKNVTKFYETIERTCQKELSQGLRNKCVKDMKERHKKIIEKLRAMDSLRVKRKTESDYKHLNEEVKVCVSKDPQGQPVITLCDPKKD